MEWLDKQIRSYTAAKHEGDRLLEAGETEDANLKLQEALETLEKAYRREHDETYSLLTKCWKSLVEKNLAMGDQLLEEENFTAAREHYQIALDLAPSTQEKNDIRVKLGQTAPERATTGLTKMFEEVQADPRSPEALYNFATELAVEGYFPEAVTYLEQLIAITPDDFDAHFKLGNALADCERFDEAERAYNKARDTGADAAEIDYRLAQIQVAHGDHAAAGRLLVRALSLKGDHIEAQRALAHLHYVEGEYDRAVQAFNKVLEIDPEDSEVYLELGDLHEIRGDMEQARASWQKAIDVEPDGDFAGFANDKLRKSGEDNP